MRKNAPTLAIVAVDTEENERLRFGVKYSVPIHSRSESLEPRVAQGLGHVVGGLEVLGPRTASEPP